MQTLLPLSLLLPICSGQFQIPGLGQFFQPPQAQQQEPTFGSAILDSLLHFVDGRSQPQPQAAPMMMARPNAMPSAPMNNFASSAVPWAPRPTQMMPRPAAMPMPIPCQDDSYSQTSAHVSELEQKLKELRQDASVSQEEVAMTQELIDTLKKKISSRSAAKLTRGASQLNLLAAAPPAAPAEPQDRSSVSTLEDVLASSSGDFKLIENLIERRMKIEDDPTMATTLQKAVNYHRVVVNAYKKYANGEPCDNMALKQAAERLKVLAKQEQDKFDAAVEKGGETVKLKKLYCKAKKEKVSEVSEVKAANEDKWNDFRAKHTCIPMSSPMPAPKCHTGVESLRGPMEAYISCQNSLNSLRDLIAQKRTELSALKNRNSTAAADWQPPAPLSLPDVVTLKPPEMFPNAFPNRDGMPLVAKEMPAKGEITSIPSKAPKMSIGDETLTEDPSMPEGNANELDEKAMSWESTIAEKDKEIEKLKSMIVKATPQPTVPPLASTPKPLLPVNPTTGEVEVPCPSDEEVKTATILKAKDTRELVQLKTDEAKLAMLKTDLDNKMAAKAAELEKRKQTAIVESSKLTKELGDSQNTWEEALNNEKRDEAVRWEKKAAIVAANAAKAIEKCSKPAMTESSSQASIATVMGNAVAEQATFN